MNTDKPRLGLLVFSLQLAALGFFLSGCNLLPDPQSDPVRYFTLSGPPTGASAPDAVVVRPVRLAGHLRNRNMAVRVSENEVTYLEDVRWAEPLDEAITQALRNRLRQVGGGGSINVQIQRCELVRNAGNSVQLTATYTITPPGGEPKPGAFTATPRAWTGGDHGALVGLLRESVEELADAIATTAASH
ncbi:MAG TPA: PqiC family protein [Lacunisphaera sp.]|nr:PqiC family protein [Lacunisphaera sp.]